MPIRDIDESTKYTKGIELGGTFAKGNSYGTELDYFLFKGYADFNHVGFALNRLFGTEPKRLTGVYLLGGSPDTCFSYWMEQYDDDGLVHRCNQDERVKWRDSEGVMQHEPIICLRVTVDGTNHNLCECSRRGRLHIRIPEVDKSIGQMLRFIVTTGSKIDHQHIISYLRDVYREYTQGHKIPFHKIPFILEREKGVILNDDGHGNMQESTHWFIKIRMDESFVHMTETDTDKYKPRSYFPYLETQFEKHLPEHSVEQFVQSFGMNYEQFQKDFPFLVDVREMVLAWVVQNEFPIVITGVYCHTRKIRTVRSRRQFIYEMDTGFVDVKAWGREIFRKAGYQVEQWKGDGKRTTLEIPIIARLGFTTKTKHIKIASVPRLPDRLVSIPE